MIGALGYLGVGFVGHLIVLGTSFDWTNVWTFAVILGWPLALWALVLVIGLIVAVISGGALGFGALANRRKRKAARSRYPERFNRFDF